MYIGSMYFVILQQQLFLDAVLAPPTVQQILAFSEIKHALVQ